MQTHLSHFYKLSLVQSALLPRDFAQYAQQNQLETPQ